MGSQGRGAKRNEMNGGAARSSVKPVSDMRGEDEEETSELGEMLRDARDYLTRFAWCAGIEEEYFGLGIGGIVAVFLFRIQPIGEADEWLWVVVGDLPSAYIVTDRAPSPGKALAVYCELMEDWIDALRSGGDMRRVFPVNASPSAEHADQLEKRIALLRKKILPTYC